MKQSYAVVEISPDQFEDYHSKMQNKQTVIAFDQEWYITEVSLETETEGWIEYDRYFATLVWAYRRPFGYNPRVTRI